jgi:hypothetical protein
MDLKNTLNIWPFWCEIFCIKKTEGPPCHTAKRTNGNGGDGTNPVNRIFWPPWIIHPQLQAIHKPKTQLAGGVANVLGGKWRQSALTHTKSGALHIEQLLPNFRSWLALAIGTAVWVGATTEE